MGRHIIINGDLVATTGNLYTRSISAGGSWYPADSERITPPGGCLEIIEDTGSIFDSYYVTGFMVCGGILGHSKGAIAAFKDIYSFTVRDYEAGLEQVKSMLELEIPEPNKGLFLQQQFVSVFSLMEQFLSCTFVRQTCDREDSYRRVLASGELLKNSNSRDNRVLNGPDGLTRELK